MQRIIDFQNVAVLEAFSARLAKVVSGGLAVYLIGDLGAGKTTFVRCFLRSLNYMGTVRSPTFTLVEEYQLAQFTVAHFDLYRLTQPRDFLSIGGDEYFNAATICFIEWPERGAGVLPEPDLTIQLQITGATTRLGIIQSFTKRGEQLLMMSDGQ